MLHSRTIIRWFRIIIVTIMTVGIYAMIVITNMIGIAFVRIIGIGGIIIHYCDVCECVCFSIQSARDPMVLLRVTFTLWGGRILPLASILFPLLDSR